MSNIRTPEEIAALSAEAERRVRAGENRAEVARALGVHVSTVRDWALKGGWRRKDLDCIVDPVRREFVLAQIGLRERTRNDERTRLVAQARQKLSRAVAALAAADRLGAVPSTPAIPPRQVAIDTAHSLLEQGRFAEADRAASFALRIARAEDASAARDDALWRADREKAAKWWEAQLAQYNALVDDAEKMAGQIAAQLQSEQDMMADKCCPTCCRPIDFFPPDMQAESEQLDEEREAAEQGPDAADSADSGD